MVGIIWWISRNRIPKLLFGIGLCYESRNNEKDIIKDRIPQLSVYWWPHVNRNCCLWRHNPLWYVKLILEAHTGSKEQLRSNNTSIYTRELLAAMDLNSSSILILWRKAKACHDNVSCYGLLKTLPDGHMKPKIAQSATRYVQRVICNAKTEL